METENSKQAWWIPPPKRSKRVQTHCASQIKNDTRVPHFGKTESYVYEYQDGRDSERGSECCRGGKEVTPFIASLRLPKYPPT